MHYVIDASVAIKWFLKETFSEKARSLLTTDTEWIIPKLFFLETTAILTKKFRRRELSASQVRHIFDVLQSVPFTIYEDRTLLSAALSLSLNTHTSVYDSMYLTLAISEQTTFITADKRFANRIKQTGYGSFITNIKEL